MFTSKSLYPAVLAVVVLCMFTPGALAFGAGNIAGISKVEGVNWRHGDLEDTLLTLAMARVLGNGKFDKLTVQRVYFGNWLRDYSQAIDIGTVKAVSSEAIRLLLCVLGFMTFGFGSKEFEITADRLGTYRPEDHIDNPKGYGAGAGDPRQYDRRLRGPIDEQRELSIDPETGMKNYIANERADIMTSAQHVRKLFGDSIELARRYRRSNNKDEIYEALRLLGTGLHCLEDFLAHSNYTELALIEMGERDVFPHVGRDTRMRLDGARDEVYPLVTGTFGGVDFLHSVTGEVSDKLTQNELDELEGTLKNNKQGNASMIEDLLNKIPDGILGGDKKGEMQNIQDNANNSQMQNTQVSPRDPEEFTQYVQNIFKQIMPAIEFHDELMKTISEMIEKIPILPKILEQLEEQMSVWVFSIMAPFVVPILQQVKNELRTGSHEIIESSEAEQHVVFDDDRSSDPTHSMLSKDHFSNILNEVAGKTASKVVAWATPQIMELWDDDGRNPDEVITNIIFGVMHHPAQRDQANGPIREGRQIMFDSVRRWWDEMDNGAKDELRRKLSREGVKNGENHKEGVHDTGHGCGKPLGMKKNYQGGEGGSMEDRIAGAAAGAIYEGITGGIGNVLEQQTGINLPSGQGGHPVQVEESSSHKGGLGGFLSSVGKSLLGDDFKSSEKESYSSRRDDNNSHTESRTEYGHSGGRYEQATETRTDYNDGRESTSYKRYEQDEDRRGNTTGYGYEERTESRPGHETRTERREEYGGSQNYGGGSNSGYGGNSNYGGGNSGSGGYGGGDSYGRGNSGGDSYGGGNSSYSGGNSGSGGYGGGNSGYGGGDSYGRESRDNESSSYGRREDRNESSGGYGSSRRDEYEGGSSGGYGGRRNDEGYGGGESESYSRRRDDEYEERRDEYGSNRRY
ncbi:heterokaryon incompatibility protein het-C domain-containing protein [Apiospora kogelbergensis]|uniref:Heterokaryon incompatibility protein het-C domain-containing protein n=1 Tax=Apiospora kogelbergensis TaxID=1337665 RepID=A0AAW0RCM0_9PEZI